MSEDWDLPGYDLEELLGFGATGEVWRARQRATGEPVALKRLRSGADPAAAEALRREAELLASFATPHLVRLREVVGAGSGLVLVLEHAAGGSLAGLLARRGSLSPGEVVTVIFPLAQALAAMHARGLLHGDVTPANVLFTAAGMPLLADLGTARPAADPHGPVQGTAEYVDPAVAAGGAPGPASDVWALGALCHYLLAGSAPHEAASVPSVLDAARDGSRAPLGLLAPSVPRALVVAVEQALRREPSARPSAQELGQAVWQACPAMPVRLSGALPAAGPVPEVRPTHRVDRPGPAHAVAGPSTRRTRLAVPGLVAAGAAGVLVLAAAGGWALGRGEPAATALPPASTAPPTSARPAAAALVLVPTPAARSASPVVRPTRSAATPGPLLSRAPASPKGIQPPATGWASVLDGLDAVRSEAFATGDPALLGQVYAPHSAALDADRAALRSLTASGRRARGVRHVVREVRPGPVDADRAALRVTDVLAAYTVVDARGRVVERVPGRAAQRYDVRLAAVDGSWRLVSVTPA